MAGEIKLNCKAAAAALLPFKAREQAKSREYEGPWSQAMVDTVWRAIGYPPPAPEVPPSLIGWQRGLGRAVNLLVQDGGKKKRGYTSEERKFLNFWGQAVADVCRKQSTLSKVAGGVLQVASFMAPVVGTAFEVAEKAGNAALEIERQKKLLKTGTELLTKAAESQAIATPAPVTALPMAPTLPPLAVAPATLVPVREPGFVNPLAPLPTAPVKRARTVTPRDYAILAGIGVALYLLIRSR